jgi:hypothetical protein
MTELALKGTAREQLKSILLEEVEGETSVNLPQLANRVVDIVRGDQDLLDGLVEEIVRPYVYEQGVQLFASTRPGSVLRFGEEAVDREKVEGRARILSSRFERWMEHADGRYINFMEMRKVDLEEAAGQRKARATTELKVAEFELYLARQLQGKEKVGDRFTPDELETMWAKAYPKEQS